MPALNEQEVLGYIGSSGAGWERIMYDKEAQVSKTLGFGLIGLGEIAYKSTGKLFQETTHARMVAGVDPVADVARSYEETYGIPCSTDLDDLLGHPDVDAVIVSTPHNLHASLGIRAAEAGKHVIVEKPMATRLEDADALIEACERAGVLCSSKEGGVRYQSDTIRARALIEQGAIGEVMAVQIYGASEKPASYWTGGYTGRVRTQWRMSRAESGGGILVMNYVYDVHRLLYLTGMDVTRVFAEYDTFRTDVEVEDFITVTLRFENGALGTLTASSCVPGARKSGFPGTASSGNRIYGTAGQIVFHGGELLVYTENEVQGLERGAWTKIALEGAKSNAYVTYIDRFAEAALSGQPAEVPGQAGRKTREVILAAYRAGENHGPVELPMEAGRDVR